QAFVGALGGPPPCTNNCVTPPVGACPQTVANGYYNGTPVPAQLHYFGATTGDVDDPVPASAQLTDTSGVPIAGKTITFTFGSQSAPATTDAVGVAHHTFMVLESLSPLQMSAQFVGDASATAASTASVTFTPRAEETGLQYTGSRFVPTGVNTTL